MAYSKLELDNPSTVLNPNHISSTYIHYRNTVKQHHGKPHIIATTEKDDS